MRVTPSTQAHSHSHSLPLTAHHFPFTCTGSLSSIDCATPVQQITPVQPPPLEGWFHVNVWSGASPQQRATPAVQASGNCFVRTWMVAFIYGRAEQMGNVFVLYGRWCSRQDVRDWVLAWVYYDYCYYYCEKRVRSSHEVNSGFRAFLLEDG